MLFGFRVLLGSTGIEGSATLTALALFGSL